MPHIKNELNKLAKEFQVNGILKSTIIITNKIFFQIKLIIMSYPIRKKILSCQKNSEDNISVIFYTTHKCASTFIKKLFHKLLKKSQYQYVDYEWVIERLGNKIYLESPYNLYLRKFLEENYSELYHLHGKIYGPQRNSLDFPGRTKFKHVFFLRDPRDVLVSAYFSLVHTHSEPRNTLTKNEFINVRRRVEEQGIDDFALEAAEEWIVPIYNHYKELRNTAQDHLYLKYDLFVEDTPEFVKLLSGYLGLRPTEKEIQAITKEANPVQKTEIMRHKRSGKSGQYLEKLKPETVEKLNVILSKILVEWDFAI